MTMMNIKILKNELRFRIDHSDVELLLAGENLLLEMSIFPEHSLCFILSVIDAANQKLQFVSEKSTVKLFVLKDALLALQKRLPSKEGIQENVMDCGGKTLKLTVEVDLKRR